MEERKSKFKNFNSTRKRNDRAFIVILLVSKSVRSTQKNPKKTTINAITFLEIKFTILVEGEEKKNIRAPSGIILGSY
jgi:hypothetical protein